jgi:hypothetical protein
MLSGCASNQTYDRDDVDSFVTEFYAWVDNVETVTLNSDLGENVLIGATHGAIVGSSYHDSDDILRGFLAGGIVAGLITALVEGDNNGYEYQLSAIDGDSVTVLSQQESAQLGDCVVVRVTHSVRIQSVDAERCAE